MALVSGGRSTLNPNAPPFIPASVRQMDDFSPEWWNLVTTSSWFRDYWLSQHHGEEDVFVREDNGFDDNDVARLLPDNIDLVVEDDILNVEAQYEEFLHSSEPAYGMKTVKGMSEYGLYRNNDSLTKNLSVSNVRSPKFLGEPAKYWEKPTKHVSPKYVPGFLQQPR